MTELKSPDGLSDAAGHVREFLQELSDSYPEPLHIAFLGSQSKEEIDVFVLPHSDKKILNPDKIKLFSQTMAESFQSTQMDRSFFYFFLHKELSLSVNSETVHFLFYPTKKYLDFWELKSFVTSVNETGTFLAGNPEYIADLCEPYKNRKAQKNKILEEHLGYYSWIAVNYFLYSHTGCVGDLSNNKTILDKLAYSYRFALTELLNVKLGKKREIHSYNWDNLIQQQEIIPEQYHDALEKILDFKNTESVALDQEFIDYCFFEYCALHNHILSNGDNI